MNKQAQNHAEIGSPPLGILAASEILAGIALEFEGGFSQTRLKTCDIIGTPVFSNLEDQRMLIGYARVSTEDQSMDLQTDALKAAGCHERWIYQESASGVKAKRPKLDECIKCLREGDCLVVWRLDRLGRSLKELISIMELLNEHNIDLRSLNESLDTSTPTGKLTFHLFGAIAEFERNLISERTKAGLAAARKRGRVGGRKPLLTPSQARMAITALAVPGAFVSDVAKDLGVSRATLYRAISKEEYEQAGRVKAAQQKKELGE